MTEQEIPFLSLKEQNAPYIAEMQEAATRVIASGWYLHGPETKAFERELAAYCGAAWCVAVSNGLDALRLTLRAWVLMGKLHPGDGVLVAANTYIASVLAITDAGLTPVLVEPDLLTMNLSAAATRDAITAGVKAMMIVHLYGNPCWNEKLHALAQENNLLVIEDNAQAIGARASSFGIASDSRITGAIGHAGCFSFYPTKNIGALGDAGAVTGFDPELQRTIRALSNYGSEQRYVNEYQGFNCRMDELQAAMLRVKLRHIEEETARRNRIAAIYESAIDNPEIIKPVIQPDATHVWHQYVVRCKNRDKVREYLAAHGIATDIHYPTPPHLQQCYLGKLRHGSLPLTTQLSREVLSLPIGSVTPEQAHRISALLSRQR